MEDFFENGAISLHIVGRDGTILRANKAELDLLGYPAEDYIGRCITDFHADPPVIEDILARLLRGETIRRYPARLRARDGSIKHVEITSSGQFDDGDFLNTRCFTVDVTNLIEAREEAGRKDDLLRQVLDALPAAIFMVDAAGKLTYVNNAAVELLGHKPRIGEDDWHTTFRLFSLDGQEMSYETRPMTTVLKQNRAVWGVEAQTARADGSLMPVMLFPTPIRDKRGNLSGAVNMFVDMSDRKQAEDMFRIAVEASPSGMILADNAGQIVLVNGAAAQLFGYSESELMSLTIEDLVPARIKEEHVGFRNDYARQPEVREMGAGRELFGLRKDGIEVPVEIGLNPIRANQEAMILSTIIDISERQRADEREKLLVRELQHRSNNIFATVQAVVARSLSGDRTLHQTQKTLEARLAALARSYQLLNESEWSAVSLGEIVRAALEPFGDRAEIVGDIVTLETGEAQNFSLVLHELATNAAKYGAFSVREGKVEVRWSLLASDDDLQLQFDWRERGGPAVAPPSRQGFGTSLLSRVFPETQLDFASDGLRCRINKRLSKKDSVG